MYTVANVKATNFRSFKELSFDPSNEMVTFLFGENRDEELCESNGAGKSSVIKAIIWCLTGITDDGLSSKGYITYGEDTSTVSVTLDSRSLDEVIVLTRSVSKKSSVKLTASLNGEDQGHLFDTKEVESWLYNKIGISKEDLSNYYLIDQGNANSFLSATDSKKKAIISRIAGFNHLDDKVTFLKAERKKQQDKLDTCIAYKYSGEATKAAMEANIEKYSSVEKIEDTVGLRDEITKHREKYTLLQSKLADFEELKEPDSTDRDNAYRRHLKAKNERANNLSVIKLNRDIIESSKAQLKSNKIDCSACGHTNAIDQATEDKFHVKIEQAEGKIEEASRDLDTDEYIENLLEQYETLSAEYTEEVKAYTRSKDAFNKAKKQVDEVRDKCTALEAEITQINQKNELLQRSIDMIAEWEYEAKTIENDLVKLESNIDKINSRIGNIDYWIKSFGNNGSFRSFLARKTLKAIAFYINEKLDKFRVGMKVNIEGFTERASGGVSDKINITVTNSRGETKPFAAYSGGQKSRLNTCSVLAIKDFFNTADGVEGLDLLILDEFLDHMDVLGIRASEKILVESQTTCLVVSHVVSSPTYAEGVKIILENGTSKLM